MKNKWQSVRHLSLRNGRKYQVQRLGGIYIYREHEGMTLWVDENNDDVEPIPVISGEFYREITS